MGVRFACPRFREAFLPLRNSFPDRPSGREHLPPEAAHTRHRGQTRRRFRARDAPRRARRRRPRGLRPEPMPPPEAAGPARYQTAHRMPGTRRNPVPRPETRHPARAKTTLRTQCTRRCEAPHGAPSAAGPQWPGRRVRPVHRWAGKETAIVTTAPEPPAESRAPSGNRASHQEARRPAIPAPGRRPRAATRGKTTRRTPDTAGARSSTVCQAPPDPGPPAGLRAPCQGSAGPPHARRRRIPAPSPGRKPRAPPRAEWSPTPCSPAGRMPGLRRPWRWWRSSRRPSGCTRWCRRRR